MTEIIQVIVLGLLQGVAELFPISSLGHTVIIPAYLGWGNLNTSPSFLPIVVTLAPGHGAGARSLLLARLGGALTRLL